MENLTPPALRADMYEPVERPSFNNERFLPSITGSKRTLTEGDSIILPKSITDTFRLDEMKTAKTTIGKIIVRDDGITIQVIINTEGSPITREFPATDPLFDLGEIPKSFGLETKDITEARELSYTEKREQLLEKSQALAIREAEIRKEITKLQETLNITSGEVVPATPILVEQKMSPAEKLERRNKLYGEAWSVIKEKGIDRIVIHGSRVKYNPTESEESLGKTVAKNEKREPLKKGDFVDVIEPDLDVESALWLLNLKDTENKPLIKINENAYTESTKKGNSDIKKTTPGQVVIHIDRGGKDFEIEVIDGVTHIYCDHHTEEFGDPTSATEIVDKIMSRGEEYQNVKKVKPWIENYVSYVTAMDNLSYVTATVPGGKKMFDKNTFLQKWPGSLFAIGNAMSVAEIQRSFRLNDSPWRPEHDIINTKEIVEKKKTDAQAALYGAEEARKRAIENGIPEETPEMGKLVYHSFSRKGGLNVIPDKLGFIATQAMGCDTFIHFNPETGGFRINSSKDITPIAERLKEIYPGLVVVRGVMIFPPNNPKLLKSISEEQFLHALGLK